MAGLSPTSGSGLRKQASSDAIVQAPNSIPQANAPTRKQYRSKDPYALDFDDETDLANPEPKDNASDVFPFFRSSSDPVKQAQSSINKPAAAQTKRLDVKSNCPPV